MGDGRLGEIARFGNGERLGRDDQAIDEGVLQFRTGSRRGRAAGRRDGWTILVGVGRRGQADIAEGRPPDVGELLTIMFKTLQATQPRIVEVAGAINAEAA